MGTAGMTSLPYDARRQGSVLSSVAARGSRLLQAARTQLWYKALDAVVTAPVRPRASFGASLRLLLDPRQAHYDRVGALVGAAERLLPGTSRRLARALLRPEALPLNAGRAELLAYGSGGTVFLLALGDERWVLKIYRRSLGMQGKRLTAIAREFQEKAATVARWYDEGPDPLVAPVHFLIAHSPLRRAPALASLQRYLPGPHRDLFTGISDDELRQLGRRDPEFWRQLRHFVQVSLRVYANEGRCLDFVGTGNVIVVPAGDRQRIVILDYGIFDRDLLARAPKTSARLEERLVRLHALEALLSEAGRPEGYNG